MWQCVGSSHSLDLRPGLPTSHLPKAEISKPYWNIYSWRFADARLFLLLHYIRFTIKWKMKDHLWTLRVEWNMTKCQRSQCSDIQSSTEPSFVMHVKPEIIFENNPSSCQSRSAPSMYSYHKSFFFHCLLRDSVLYEPSIFFSWTMCSVYWCSLSAFHIVLAILWESNDDEDISVRISRVPVYTWVLRKGSKGRVRAVLTLKSANQELACLALLTQSEVQDTYFSRWHDHMMYTPQPVDFFQNIEVPNNVPNELSFKTVLLALHSILQGDLQVDSFPEWKWVALLKL
jgi:hypothetical protein